MARHFTLTIHEMDQPAMHTEHFTCRKLDTAKAHAAKVLATFDGYGDKVYARLQYAALGPCHIITLWRGVWRNDYHHAKALAAAGYGRKTLETIERNLAFERAPIERQIELLDAARADALARQWEALCAQ
jgi:hypothetical protein